MKTSAEIFHDCKKIVFDSNYSFAKDWKQEDSKRVLIGMVPNYFPREIIHAANGLAVGIIGDGLKDPNISIQDVSYPNSCSMLSGVFELVKKGHLEGFDGFLLPTQCDSLKAIDEINEINRKCFFVKYINFPQYFQTIIGDVLNHYIVQNVLDEIYKINKIEVTAEKLNNSIQLFKNNLKSTEKIYNLRKKYPEKITQEDLYYTVCSGLFMPIEKHNEYLNKIIELLIEGGIEKDDDIFYIYSGAFC